MKKIYGILTMFLLLVSALAFQVVLAEENVTDSEENVTDSEAIADSEEPSLIAEAPEEEVPSTFRYGWEKFKLNFIMNQTIKAERELRLAQWKVSEARIATQMGDIKRAEKAMQENQRLMERVQERLEKMQNQSLTPGLDNALQVHEERINRLNLALENTNLSEEQRLRIEARISKTENVSKILEENRARIQENRRTRLNRLNERLENLSNRVEDMEDVNDSEDELEDMEDVNDSEIAQENGRN